MKKIALLSLIVMLLLCGFGTAMADHEHYTYCDAEDPTVCVECGAAGDQLRVEHNMTYTKANSSIDNSCHLVTCACGETNYYDWHYSYCDNEAQTKCEACGASGDDYSIIKKHCSIALYTNEKDHWEVCQACNEETFRGAHYYFCVEKNQNICAYCSYEGAPSYDVRHPGGMVNDYTQVEGDHVNHVWYCTGCGEGSTKPHVATFVYTLKDKENHQETCTTCGHGSYRYVHMSSCDNDTVCSGCGATDVEFYSVSHVPVVVSSDAEQDTLSCACGEQQSTKKHFAYCDKDPDVCENCGKSIKTDGIIISTVEHQNTKYIRDNTEHWQVCTSCDEELTEHSKHYATCVGNDQVCIACHADANDGAVVVKWHYMDQNRIGFCWSCGEQYSTKIMYLPTGITTIESQAFAGTDVEIIVIPAGVTYVAPDAFANCSSLKEYFVHESSRPALKDINFGNDVHLCVIN